MCGDFQTLYLANSQSKRLFSLACQPELHSSADPSLGGDDNRGMPGVDEFLKEHRCERLCNLMDLPELPAPSGRPWSKGGRRRGSDVSEPRMFNVFPPIQQDADTAD